MLYYICMRKIFEESQKFGLGVWFHYVNILRFVLVYDVLYIFNGATFLEIAKVESIYLISIWWKIRKKLKSYIGEIKFGVF